MELKKAQTEEQFQAEAKKYVINMQNNSRKLHKKNGCSNSQWIKKYYDFDTLKEVKDSSIPHEKCKHCFAGNSTKKVIVVTEQERIAEPIKAPATKEKLDTTTVLVEKTKTHASANSIALKACGIMGLLWTLLFATVDMSEDIESSRAIYCAAGVVYAAIMFLIDGLRGRKPLCLYNDRMVGYAANIHQEKTIYMSDIAYLEKNYKHNGMKTLTVTTKSNNFYVFTEIGNIDEFCNKIAELKESDKQFKGTFVSPGFFSKGERGRTVAMIAATIILIIIIINVIINHEPKKNYTDTERENHEWANNVKDWIDTNGQYYR